MFVHENVLGIRDTTPQASNEPGRNVLTPSRSRQTNSQTSRTRARDDNDNEQPAPPPKKPKTVSSSQTKGGKKKEAPARFNGQCVGVDFGTACSGFATVKADEATPHVEVHKNWSRSQNNVKDKVPTVLAYPEENDGADLKFGLGCKAGMRIVTFFKPHFDADTSAEEFADELLEIAIGGTMMRLPAGMDVEKVTTDFLRCFYEKIMEKFEHMYGQSGLEGTPLRFTLTIPATWKEPIRNRYLKCAEEAGFGKREIDHLALLDEPEAAAIAAMEPTNRGAQLHHFELDSCVMVLDLGGGTSDGVCFRIHHLQPLELKEACPRGAFKCGGTDIDRSLLAWCYEKFGPAFANLPDEKVGPGSNFMQTFEDYKCEFEGTAEEDETIYPITLRIPKLNETDPKLQEIYDFEDFRIKLRGKDIKSFFARVVDKACELADQLLHAVADTDAPDVHTIVLCGGLGSSPYMKERIEDHLQDWVSEGGKVIHPEKPWPAVAIGAALAGLDKSAVKSRKARYHIGITLHEKFINSKHSRADTYKCPLLGLRVKGRMCWHLNRGEDITMGMKKTIKTYAAIKVPKRAGERIILRQVLYASEEDDAPEQMEETIVDQIGVINMDVTNVVNTKKEQYRKVHGEYPSTVDFDIFIDVIVGSAKGILEVRGRSGRQKLASATIEYSYDSNSEES